MVCKMSKRQIKLGRAFLARGLIRENTEIYRFYKLISENTNWEYSAEGGAG